MSVTVAFDNMQKERVVLSSFGCFIIVAGINWQRDKGVFVRGSNE